MRWITQNNGSLTMNDSFCLTCGASLEAGADACPHCPAETLPLARALRSLPDGGPVAQASEIAFDTVGHEDDILIETTHHIYKFTVADPRRRRGTLSGGVITGPPLEVLFVGAVTGGKKTPRLDGGALRVGQRALFYAGAGEGVMPLVTSAITRLIRLRGPRRRQQG